MNSKVIALFCCVNFLMVNAASWQEVLENHLDVQNASHQLIMRQYQSFLDGQAPVIAAANIRAIPIVENNENLVDVAVMQHPRISMMTEAECLFAHESWQDIDWRSEHCSKVRQSVFDAMVRMVAELDKLAPTFGYKEGMIEIKLFEGLRDLATQKQLFDSKMELIWAANPNMTREEAYAETSKWVSQYIDNVPVHSTGAAIDIHLYDHESKKFCNIGRFNAGGPLAPMFSSDVRLTEEQKNNRLFLLMAATSAGLTNYVHEFWHYSVGDRYAAHYREQSPDARVAQFGSVIL